MRPTTFSPSASDATYRVDDPKVFAVNAEGVLTNEQQQAFSPRAMIRSQLLGYAVTAGGIALMMAALAAGETGEKLAQSLPQFPFARLLYALSGVGIGLLILMPKLLWLSRRLPALRNDLRRRALERIRGTIDWEGRRFVARSADGREIEDLCERFNAAPGAYEFFVLPESFLLLSLRPVGTEEEQDRATTELLQRLLRRSPDSRERHARGEVTAWERALSVPTMPATSYFVVAVAVMLLPIALFVLWDFWKSLRASTPIGAAGIVALAIALAAIAGFVVVAFALRRNLRAPLIRLEGRVFLREIERPKQRTIYRLEINKQSFDVPGSFAVALVEQTRYRIYAIRGSARILSIEAIADDTNNARSVEE